jgi:Tfp pilus assembly protein PilE
MRQRQQGMTFIGLLCVLALVGVIGYGGIVLVPVYLDYMKIARILDQTAAETKGEAADIGAIRVSLERHWNIEDPTGMDFKEVQITKDDGVLQLHATYDRSVSYIGNVSLTAHFDKTVTAR